MPSHKSSLIMKVISKMNLKLDFNSLLPLLSKDLFDTNIMKYVLIDNQEHYLEIVMTYVNSLIPEEVMSEDPQDICDEDLTSEYKPDLWIMYLIKGLREKYQYKEEFFIRYLTSRLPDVRIEAITALRVFKARWSELVIPALEHASEIEPTNKIKKRFQRLLGKQSDSKEKEQRYIEIEEIKVAPSPWDVCLFTTTIAGTYFHDLCVLKGRIETGDILYLMREPENKFDNKAILVTTEDGYVLGYIPRIQNSLPTDLMEAGEKLYAILESEYLDHGKPEIQIMLSKGHMEESNVIEFPLGIFRSKK